MMKVTFTNILKQIFAGLFLLCFCISANAGYMEKFPITVAQPDGTEIHCYATGDEFYNWVHDENGFTLIRDPQTGVVVYARLENDELISTGYTVGSVDPATAGLHPWTIISPEKRMQIRSGFLKKIPEKPIKDGYQVPTIGGHNNGTLNNLVMYIRFSDETEFPPKANVYADMHNTEEAGVPSQYSYFKAVSNEKTFIPSTFYPVSSGDVIISYQDIYPRSYFQPYNAATNPDGYQGGDNGEERTEREFQLLARTVEAVEHEIPTDLDIDFNNDGLVDNICFIVRGAPGDWATLLWPHRWALYTEYVTINGKQVWDFNMQIETHLDNAGASVLSHEMSHTLGSPDLYRYAYNGTPVGPWDLMASNTTPPQSMTAWMKYKYSGWIDNIPEITETGTYTLNNVWSETGNAYRIASPNSSTEFFVIEYRDKNVYWDSDLPGNGLIIYRINTLLDGNADGPPDEIYIYRRGGTSNMADDGDIKVAFFSSQSGRTAFNNFSDPPCFLSNNQPGGISISNIGESGGETMSFYVDFSMANTEISVTPDELVFADIPVGTTSESQTITVSGKELIHPILYEKTGTNHELFTIEETDWDPAVGGTLFVRFTPPANKMYISEIKFSSLGAMSKTVTLKASGINVAIDEQNMADDITIYPNPANEQLRIENHELRIENIEIFDVTGRNILSVDTQCVAYLQNGTTNIDISHLPFGIYFMKIKTETGVITRRIVKQ